MEFLFSLQYLSIYTVQEETKEEFHMINFR